MTERPGLPGERMRIGDADRDRVITALHENFALGRITAEELDERLGVALSARTVGELAPLTHDLPSGDAAVPAERPAPSTDRRPAGGFGPPRRGRGWGGPPFMFAPIFGLLMILAMGKVLFFALPLLLVLWFVSHALVGVGGRPGRFHH